MVEKPPLILSRLFAPDDTGKNKKYIEKSIPFVVRGHVSYINLKQNTFAIQFDRFNDLQLIKEVHDHYAMRPMGEPFSGKPPVNTPPSTIRIGKFAAAYIEELRHVCRVQILYVDRIRGEAEVLAIDVGAVATVPTCLLFALPGHFTCDQYRTALALVCRLPILDDSSVLTKVKDLWVEMHVDVFVLSSVAPHMAAVTSVDGDDNFVDAVLNSLPNILIASFQKVFDERIWALINRNDHRRPVTYAPTPSHRDNQYVATVISVIGINSIQLRDFDFGIMLVMLQKAMNQHYNNASFRAGMALLRDEIAPGLGVVFMYNKTFYRGTIIDELPDGRIWIDSVDFPGSLYKLPIKHVFHPADELIQIHPLVRTVDLSEGVLPAMAIEKHFVAASVLTPGMVVDVYMVNGQEQIRLPNGRDFQALLDLPRPEIQCPPVWTPESSISQSTASSKQKREKEDVSLHIAAAQLAETAEWKKHRKLIEKFEELTRMEAC